MKRTVERCEFKIFVTVVVVKAPDKIKSPKLHYQDEKNCVILRIYWKMLLFNEINFLIVRIIGT
jgi:hypothetical protein